MAIRTITVRVTGDVAQFTRAMRDVGAQIVMVEKRAASSVNVFRQMRGGMTALAQEAVGRTVPGLSSLAGVLGNFAVGSAATVGVLAGIALLGGAYKFLTKDLNATREAADLALKAINKPTELEEARKNVEALRKELDKLNTSSLAKIQTRGLLGLAKDFVMGGGLVSPFFGAAGMALGTATAAGKRREELTAGVATGRAQVNAILASELRSFFEAWRKILESVPLVKIRNPFEGRSTIVQGPDGEFRMSNTPRPLVRNVSAFGRGSGRMEGAIMSGRPRTAEQLEDEARRLQLAAESMAQSVADAFEAWVTGAQKAKDAVRDMVTSILRDLLRLVAQRAIVEPLANVFLSAIGGSSAAVGGSRAVVVNQSVNFAISAIDAPGVASLLQQQSGTIAQIVGDAARRSTGFRAQLVHG